ncbi:hypothetical protein HSB1_40100 [Halogranum salarium B-1]|uniref:Uncharacterized protein n=1 Tax=Halogranum salarium B-1 TaxID=1210908 RepID=J3JDN7_9EURY|nr:hypothetical protein HSB1_40100 [Halogranum salarium B-1]
MGRSRHGEFAVIGRGPCSTRPSRTRQRVSDDRVFGAEAPTQAYVSDNSS